MSSMQIGGLASGIDTTTLINQLMALEQQPLNVINQKKQDLFAKNSAFQAINTRLSALQSAANDMTLDLNLRAKSATTSNTNILTAKAGAGAAAGNYQIRVDRLATASSVTTSAPIGKAVTSTSTALSALNLASPIKAGTFTLQYTDGGTVQNAAITIAASDDLDSVFSQIAAATGGSVTASLSNNRIALSSATATNIVAGASTDTSNFLSVMNLKGATYGANPPPTGGTVTATADVDPSITATTDVLSGLGITDGNFNLRYTVGGVVQNTAISYTDGDNLDSVFTQIAAATGGSVTASLSNNRIVLSSATASNIVAGDVTDTSNFATIMSLTGAPFAANPQTSSMKSTYGIGVAQMGVGIDTTPGPSLDNLAMTSTTAGEFKINGVSIKYNTATDSINNVLGKINNSSAGVSASYNSIDDRIILTSRSTGSGAISLQDVTGNFLQAIGLNDPARQQVTNGQNALIGIVGVNGFTAATAAGDFSKDISSPTNTFSNVLPGLTLTAMKEDPAMQSMTVAADNSAITDKIKAFVGQYNQAVDAINSATAKDQPNAFDADLRNILDHMRTMLGNPVASLSGSPRTLIDIGLSTTRDDRIHLSLDETKFKSALESNPDRVAQLFQLTQPDPKDAKKNQPLGIAAQLKNYLFNVGGATGVFKTRDTSNQRQQRAYDQQIQDLNERMDQTRQGLIKQFSAMESAVSKLKSQQSAFLSQLSSLG